MDTIANRYAESLFSLAKEENQVTEYVNSIRLITDVFSNDNAFIQFFSYVLIDDDVKFNVIDKSFKGKIETYICNFLKLLIKNNRMCYILDVSKAFIILCNREQGIMEGVIYTPYALSIEEVREIEKTISENQKQKVILKREIDTTLIGGFKIDLGNQTIDNSIKNKMEVLKKELLRR